jgi:glycosyltransferase involved in cell wall biosynthesis
MADSHEVPAKVLQVIPSIADRTGGPAAAVLESSRVLSERGLTCTVLTTDLGEAASAARHTRITPQANIIAPEIDLRMYRAQQPRRLAFSAPLARAVRSAVREYDVIHIHSLFLFPQYAAYKAASRAGIPFIVSPCGALDPALRRRSRLAKALTDFLWQGRMLRTAAGIHFKTEEERRLASDLRLAKRQFVVPNGIDWTSFQESRDGDSFRYRYLGEHEGPVILNVGRFSHKKGLDILIRAFAQAHDAHSGAVLVLVGPDDEGLKPRLEQLAAETGVQDQVVFTGMLRGEELRAALSAATVWALPSKTENFGNAVIEAMAAGLPVVVSPEVNLASAIKAADAGIVSDRTPEAFATAIASLLESERRRSVLSDRAREFARAYDWDRIAAKLFQMYTLAANAASFPEELSEAMA